MMTSPMLVMTDLPHLVLLSTCAAYPIDAMVMYLRGGGLAVIFIELKSRCGVASEAQIKLREEMLAVGVKW